MKISTLKDRIEKKANTIERKQNTIAKKMAQIEKKASKVRAYGYDPEGSRYQAAETEDHDTIYWLMCDIENLKDDIKRNEDQIEECKATLEKYEKQLAGELEKEATFIKEVPQAMKDCEAMLIEEWDDSDKRRREFYKEQEKELGYREFIKEYKASGYQFIFATDEQIHNNNVKDARAFVLDLLNRVKEITGEVTDWSGVRLTVGNQGFPVLNGNVIGKEGTAEVESIYAGGYNIQKLHIRTLVKAI